MRVHNFSGDTWWLFLQQWLFARCTTRLILQNAALWKTAALLNNKRAPANCTASEKKCFLHIAALLKTAAFLKVAIIPKKVFWKLSQFIKLTGKRRTRAQPLNLCRVGFSVVSYWVVLAVQSRVWLDTTGLNPALPTLASGPLKNFSYGLITIQTF